MYSYMTREQEEIYNMLCGLSGEQVADLFTNYHGNQLLDHGFYEYLVEEDWLAGNEWGEE